MYIYIQKYMHTHIYIHRGRYLSFFFFFFLFFPFFFCYHCYFSYAWGRVIQKAMRLVTNPSTLNPEPHARNSKPLGLKARPW